MEVEKYSDAEKCDDVSSFGLHQCLILVTTNIGDDNTTVKFPNICLTLCSTPALVALILPFYIIVNATSML